MYSLATAMLTIQPQMVLATSPWSQADVNTENVGAERHQKLTLWLVTAYILSQAYMVPVIITGPSWAVWPSLTDLAVLAFAIHLGIVRSRKTQSEAITWLKRLCFATLVAGILSYLVLTLDSWGLRNSAPSTDRGRTAGLYQLYRLCQFYIVVVACSKLNITGRVRSSLRNVVGATFWISVAGLLATYFGAVTTTDLAPQLPHDLNVAGSWAFYALGVITKPLGTISFHHAYPCIQILLLAAMYIHYLPRSQSFLGGGIIATAVFCAFISGSRSGFAAAVLFGAAVIAGRWRYGVAIAFLCCLTLIPVVTLADIGDTSLTVAAERQGSIGSSYEQDGLAGRVEIWHDRFVLLNGDPSLWLIGTGFGSAPDTGANGHMLFLHIVLETGLVGLALFCCIVGTIARGLWRINQWKHVMLWVTAALLISSVTQETFYPVPAFGHFAGLYMGAIVLALKEAAPRRRIEFIEVL